MIAKFFEILSCNFLDIERVTLLQKELNSLDLDQIAMSASGIYSDVRRLEASAQAVRVDAGDHVGIAGTTPTNPEALGAVLQKAEAAKETAKRYRATYYGR